MTKQIEREPIADDFDLFDPDCAKERYEALQGTQTALTVSLRDIESVAPIYAAKGRVDALANLNAQRATLQCELTATKGALALVERVVAIHSQMATARAAMEEADRVEQQGKELAKALKALDGAMAGLATAILATFRAAGGNHLAVARLPGICNRAWISCCRDHGYRSKGGAIESAFVNLCGGVTANHAQPAGQQSVPGASPEGLRTGAKCDLKRLSDSLSALLADPDSTLPARLNSPESMLEAA